jgi:hypothetical protein
MEFKLNEFATSVLEQLQEASPNGLTPERLAIRLGGNTSYAQAYCEMLEHHGLISRDYGFVYFYIDPDNAEQTVRPTLAADIADSHQVRLIEVNPSRLQPIRGSSTSPFPSLYDPYPHMASC